MLFGLVLVTFPHFRFTEVVDLLCELRRFSGCVVADVLEYPGDVFDEVAVVVPDDNFPVVLSGVGFCGC